MTSPARVAGRLSDMDGLTPIAETNAHADPQVVYRRLRAEWGEVAPVELEPGINAWLVMGHEELCRALRHERLFAKNPVHWRDYSEGRVKPDSPLAPMMFPRPNVFFHDGSEHRRLRAPVDDALHALRLRRLNRQATEMCTALIADFAQKGEADLLEQYAMMIPTVVLGRMLGLDLETAREMHRAQMAMYAGDENAQAGNQRFEEIIGGLVRARQAEPGADVTTVIVQHPNLTDDVERTQSVLSLVGAASECTMAWVASTLLLMLTDARFSGRLRGGRLGADDALDEVLWRDPPMANFPARYALRDIELGGQPIGEGDPIILGFAAANADPRVHSGDPSHEIANRSHLAWSAGPHVCPAQAPGRLIVRIAVEAALHQLPDLRLNIPAEEIGRLKTPWTRCPATLPVTFKPFEITQLPPTA
jgi:cytochrome P450